ncbi:50S ribosomal protein L15 [Candidatus Woesebacteria bacterium RIFCSPHIGHO2_02_FULL_42_20]|uniref:Large ribosomal subunit protein uL15 n=1 Tax=Candidatus Woesebacteria bacterium RIFCSPHIGHO2_12_FULL_41_24 TaxID=1802510 RepID=A0A1F8APX4_9BACT|nr:MAG: 50S ribosomal protein L15 [Candidatus Woesebacteria bacterium RBG_16_41_13]OGM29252.1 MAG: 50S ribosomal protein L15 [Candidatus Woesebacteria bacterium RIFCSPHIGHO2_01_FULL_42_80]OGM34750.1 MAG: 50S ribosomal protein L15 [Candidatus Woesebacteria bacterium RIFCSPHIGHO2_02_FULL_42_20]OGM53661.1 MAG: 50S ribosomal protein L15 [Candidatus Woesebacteria bacterium RIFCSPHIGHO2_12_FULL_41_24]OGM67049.1 MAG: 50S ribosomal protein L15 [Candidatus Woesebacteria bacterium RIFCSPLOWO2_01_FULL_42_
MAMVGKVNAKKRKRVGRGYGSGRGGHTAGRGQKGQKSRRKIGVIFEGVKIKKSLLIRLPVRRGKEKLKPSSKPLIVNLKYLEILPSGTLVNIENLVKYKVVDSRDAKRFGLKILGDGKLTKKLEIALPISKSAMEKVKKVGGSIS